MVSPVRWNSFLQGKRCVAMLSAGGVVLGSNGGSGHETGERKNTDIGQGTPGELLWPSGMGL